MNEITRCLDCDKHDIGYQKLTNSEIIQNILNPDKSEMNECDKSENNYRGISYAELKTVFFKCIIGLRCKWKPIKPKYVYYVEFVIL